jgi:predicted XRE-type DNA-binding protein
MALKKTRSTGNVFRDLGYSPEQAESLRLRSELMMRIKQLIGRRGLTQKAAAEMLGVSQPRISDLVRGRIDLFSLDTLVDMLVKGGMRVQLSVRRSRVSRRDAA